jgi:hypothetical protein
VQLRELKEVTILVDAAVIAVVGCTIGAWFDVCVTVGVQVQRRVTRFR